MIFVRRFENLNDAMEFSKRFEESEIIIKRQKKNKKYCVSWKK